MSETTNVLYTARVHTTGGRAAGVARSSDGQLEVKLSPPGSRRPGTNPEQMFAAGWSACFEGALALAAQRRKLHLPDDTAIDAEIDLHHDDGEYYLGARLNVAIPGVDRPVAQALMDEAAVTCPYSNAVSGNIDVKYVLV